MGQKIRKRQYIVKGADMRKKILNEREKQLPGAAAVQQEHKTTDKAAPSGRQTAPSAPRRQTA